MLAKASAHLHNYADISDNIESIGKTKYSLPNI